MGVLFIVLRTERKSVKFEFTAVSEYIKVLIFLIKKYRISRYQPIYLFRTRYLLESCKKHFVEWQVFDDTLRAWVKRGIGFTCRYISTYKVGRRVWLIQGAWVRDRSFCLTPVAKTLFFGFLLNIKLKKNIWRISLFTSKSPKGKSHPISVGSSYCLFL